MERIINHSGWFLTGYLIKRNALCGQIEMGSDRNCHFSGEFWTVTKYSDLSEYFKRSKLCRFTAHVSKHRHKRSIGTFETLSLKLPDFDCALFAFVAAFDGRNLIKIFGTLCGSVNLFKTSWRIINFSCENRCQKLLASCTKWEEARVPTFNYRKDLQDWKFSDSRFLLLYIGKRSFGRKIS